MIELSRITELKLTVTSCIHVRTLLIYESFIDYRNFHMSKQKHFGIKDKLSE